MVEYKIVFPSVHIYKKEIVSMKKTTTMKKVKRGRKRENMETRKKSIIKRKDPT